MDIYLAPTCLFTTLLTISPGAIISLTALFFPIRTVGPTGSLFGTKRSIYGITFRRTKDAPCSPAHRDATLFAGKFLLPIRRIVALAGAIDDFSLPRDKLIITGRAYLGRWLRPRWQTPPRQSATSARAVPRSIAPLHCRKGGIANLAVYSFAFVVFSPAITRAKKTIFPAIKGGLAVLTDFIHDSLTRITRFLFGEQDGASDRLFGPRSLVPASLYMKRAKMSSFWR